MAHVRIVVELPRGSYVWQVLALKDDPHALPEILKIIGPVTFLKCVRKNIGSVKKGKQR